MPLPSVLKSALNEDIGRGDVTTRVTIPRGTRTSATILAKESGVVAGLGVAKSVFALIDKKIKFKPQVREGSQVKKGKVIARLSGPAYGILAAERTALNFLGHLSGVATAAREFAERVKGYKAGITDTRKTTPGLRALEKYAVKIGGCANHRMGLWDMVLIKDNHIRVQSREYRVQRVKAIRHAINLAKKNAPKGMKIEVEVGNLAEFKAALSAQPDIILLDNMPIALIRKAVKIRNALCLPAGKAGVMRNARTLLEASGNVTLKNVREIAAAGVDTISVGALTHSAKALDLSLEIV